MNTYILNKLFLALGKDKEFSYSRKEEIEDCIEDAILLFHQKEMEEIKSDNDKTFFWLYHAAINVHKNHFKHEKRNSSIDKRIESGYDLDIHDEAESTFEKLDQIAYFLRFLSNLDARIIVMNHIEGFTLKEIAELQEKPRKVIEKHHERSMKKLHEVANREGRSSAS